MTRWLVLALAGCSADEAPRQPTFDGGWGYSELPPGGVRLLTGKGALAGEPGRPLVLDDSGCGRAVVAPGDVDGDGVPDLGVVCDYDVLRLLSGAAALAGRRDEFATLDLGLGGEPPHPLGDVDGDGLGDLGVSNRTHLDGVLILPGRALRGDVVAADVSWRVVPSYWHNASGDPSPWPAGDLDGDGLADALYVGDGAELYAVPGADVAALPPGATLEIRQSPLAFGGGSLGKIALARGVGDVDGDGRPDIGIAPDPWGSGPGNAQVAQFRLLAGARPPEVAVEELPGLTGRIAHTRGFTSFVSLGDLDGDGRGELAVALVTEASPGGRSTLLGVVPGGVFPTNGVVGMPGFGLSRLGLDETDPVACDLDGDGLPELVTGAGIWAGTDLLLPGEQLPESPGIRGSVCLGDVDGDGAAELAFGDQGLE